MKTQSWLAMVATLLLPALCLAQHYQVSAPAYGQPSYGQPAYGQPGMMPMPTAPQASYEMPTQGTFCDAGGCDSGGYGSNYMDGGYGAGGCDSGCIDSSSITDCCSGCGGTYFSIFAGGAELDDQDSIGYQRDLNINYNQGYAAGAAIGRRIGRNLRTELEYTFRMQTPEVVNFNGNLPPNVRGFQASHAGMLNFAYDLVFGAGNFVPYVGGGLGVASIDSRVRYGNGVASLDGDETSAAFQWMVGMTYRARPNLEMFLEYRFFEVVEPELNRFGGPAIGSGMNVVPNPKVLLESEYVSNDILAGIRFNF